MRFIWNVEEKVYAIKALLEVMQDGLCNDVVGINQDYYATALRVVMDKVEEIQGAINEECRQRREEKGYAEQEQYDEDEEDSLLGSGSILGDEVASTPRSDCGFEGREGCEDAGDGGAKENDRFATGSFGVAMVEEHPDGSATFEVHGSKEQMQKLFSAFFADAITRGIDSAEGYTSKWVAEKQVITAAHNLEDWLRRWETEDELDYDPEVKVYRHELTEALNKWRGAVSQAKVW